jgi:hypothetical protein
MRAMIDSHHSGRYDATDAQWRAMLSELAEASVFSGTEAAGVKLGQLLPDAARFFRVGDSFVGWKHEHWRLLGDFPVMLTQKSWSPGGNIRRHGVPMPCVLLEDRSSGAVLLRGAFHGPSGIQGGAGWSRKAEDRDNVAAAKDVLSNLESSLRHMRGLFHPDHFTIAADWNAHLEVNEWARRINAALDPVPHMRIVVPIKPTHGDRAIDGHATTLPVRARRVGQKMAGFDHRRETIRTGR